MAVDVEPPEGPPAPSGGATRRWLRWGRVYVDIEPPHGPNPWTTAAGGAPVIEAPLTEPAAAPHRWRNALVFAAACLFAAVLTALLVFAFGRHGRRPALAVPATTTTTTTRPAATPVRPATIAPASRPSTSASAPAAPSTATVTTAPGGSSGTTTVNGGRAGGPITVPEGIDPATTVAPSTVAPSTVAPTTAPRRPASTTTTTPNPQAFLGVTVQDSVDGAQVLEIFAGSGAEKAGIKAGDIVTAIDRSTVITVDDLGAAILSHRPGDAVTVTVLRNGATTTVTATLGVRPAS